MFCHFVCVVLNRDYAILQTITRAAPTANLTSCTTESQQSTSLGSRGGQPCVCQYDICVGWYPCGLKYCRGKDSAGRIVSYRCGIKTCSRCRQFEFRVPTKSLCVWDEPDFQPFFIDSAASPHSSDDPLDAKDNEATALASSSARFVNDSLLLHRRGVGDFAVPVAVDVGGPGHVVRMDRRQPGWGKMVNSQQRNGQPLAKQNSALDDDEDAD